MEKRKVCGIILSILVILALGIALYFTYFFNYKCYTLACFQGHQKDCVRATFVYDTEDTTWSYNILGEKQGQCLINVEILKIKKGSTDKKILEGKSMKCFLPKGSVKTPESDLSICHGILKEEVQNVIIKNLHAQIIENLGEINSGFESI